MLIKIQTNVIHTNKHILDIKYTKYGSNINLPLNLSNLSKTYYSVLMYDLNPVAKHWVHWAQINISSQITKLPTNHGECKLNLK